MSKTSFILACAAHATALNLNFHFIHSEACPVNGFGLPSVRVPPIIGLEVGALPEDNCWICWTAMNVPQQLVSVAFEIDQSREQLVDCGHDCVTWFGSV